MFLQDLYYIAFGYPEKELNTDIALITGGGNGLGRLLAQRLGKMGTKVVVWDINKEGVYRDIKLNNFKTVSLTCIFKSTNEKFPIIH